MSRSDPVDLFLKKVMTEADVYKVPRARLETAEFLRGVIIEKSVSSILEIGTGNGFSAVFFSSLPCVKDVFTFEMDSFRISLCEQNVKYSDKIHFFPQDFLSFEGSLSADMVFIDGTKRLYRDFFEFSQRFAHDKTIFVSDNLNFKNHLENSVCLEYKHRRITNKIAEYIDFLENNSDFHTEFFFDVGDGVALTYRV